MSGDWLSAPGEEYWALVEIEELQFPLDMAWGVGVGGRFLEKMCLAQLWNWGESQWWEMKKKCIPGRENAPGIEKREGSISFLRSRNSCWMPLTTATLQVKESG